MSTAKQFSVRVCIGKSLINILPPNKFKKLTIWLQIAQANYTFLNKKAIRNADLVFIEYLFNTIETPLTL